MVRFLHMKCNNCKLAYALFVAKCTQIYVEEFKNLEDICIPVVIQVPVWMLNTMLWLLRWPSIKRSVLINFYRNTILTTSISNWFVPSPRQ